MQKPANQGKPWNKTEHDKLQEYLDQKKTEDEIAVLMQRTKQGIHAAVLKKIFLMRRQGVSDVEIAAKINWTVEEVGAVGKKEVKIDADGKAVIVEVKNTGPLRSDRDRITALEAKVEELHKLLVDVLTKK